MRRVLLVAVLAALMVVLGAGAAFAGEWNKGHFNDPGGNVPAKGNANSECLFNGQDEPDDTFLGEGVGEPIDFGPDDGLWSSTPAGAHNKAGKRVQSGGQLVAAGINPPGLQGEFCNGHLHPQK